METPEFAPTMSVRSAIVVRMVVPRMPTIDTYKHLNESDGVLTGIEEIANQVVKLNYGTHRMLSALVRARRKVGKSHERDELADEIEALLKRGLF